MHLGRHSERKDCRGRDLMCIHLDGEWISADDARLD